MANQTVSTGTPAAPINYDDASISGLLNGETITINGGAVLVNADVRHNQQAAVMGNVTLSATLGGSFVIDGSQVWEVPFSASTGNVPTQGALGTNGVTGGTSAATGELTRVWATGSLEPAVAAAAMPATGFIKLRSKVGTFQNGETITLPGGATITASGAGKRSWVHVVGRENTSITINRLNNFEITGDWYELGTTNGLDDQTIQFPVADECPALQIETAAGSGVYEWWLNAGRKWVGQVQPSSQTVNGMTETVNIATRPAYNDPAGFLHTMRQLRETATTAIHVTTSSLGATTVEAGIYTLRTYVQKDGRRFGFVQIASGVGNADRYGVIIDFDTAGAVVATPTIGSPLNTSNTVTSIGGGVYLVELTINVVSAATSTLTGTVGASDSASPTLVNGIPSYAGNTGQGIWYTELQLAAPSATQYVSSTDERGKFFFSNPQTGSIIFAQRAGRTAGLKPPSGCKIRIGNVICSNAPAIDYTINSVQTTIGPGINPRYGLVTNASGAVVINHVTMNWLRTITSPFSVTLENSGLCQWVVSGAASTQTYTNLGVGLSRDASLSGLFSISTSPTGTTLTDIRVCRDRHTLNAVQLSTSANITSTRVRAEGFGNFEGRIGRVGGTSVGYSIANCDLIVTDDTTLVGTGFNIVATTNFQIKNTKYAERIIGETEAADAGTAISVTTACVNGVIDGFALIPGLTNVHPYTQAVILSTNVNRVEVRNIGTPTAPLNGGSVVANQMRQIVNFAGTVFNSIAQRVYGENVVQALAHNGTNQNILAINVWGDAADSPNFDVGLGVLMQGCRWTNSRTIRPSVYGVHWQDAFTGTTSGRLLISGNEPLPSTADQCVATFGPNANFTAAGDVAMPNVDDTITWTMPYYALGHTGIAQFGYGASATNTWLHTGTNPQNFEYEYQIDKNTGTFSGWKWLLSQGRQSAGGTSGTNTVTINSADVAAMTRKPAVGDYIATPSGRLPAGTTITGVSGAGNNVLTLSANFTASETGVFTFFKDIVAETISPTTGYKLKVKVRVNTASTTNTFGFLSIPFDTNATDQQIQYPPPNDATGTVTNLLAGSRVQIYNEDTSTELFNAIVAGTSTSLSYYNGVTVSAGDTVRIRVSKLGHLPQTLLAIATATGFAATASQQTDAIYVANGIDGSTVTEFTADYPNVQLDISDSDGVTTVQRVYAWLRHTETSEQGIRLWFDAITPTDEVNYLIDATQVNLKLDNTSASPVAVGGGRMYRSDTATVIAATSGSIQMDPFRVYVTESGANTIATAIRAELNTELTRIDAAISTRNATAPDNAGIAAIKAKTDNLPADPASNTQVETRLAANSYITAPTAQQNAEAVRTELTTEMERIDVAISTRNATAPDNAGIAAIKAKTDTLVSASDQTIGATVDQVAAIVEAAISA